MKQKQEMKNKRKHPLEKIYNHIQILICISYLAMILGVIALIADGSTVSLIVLVSGACSWFISKLGLLIVETIYFYTEVHGIKTYNGTVAAPLSAKE